MHFSNKEKSDDAHRFPSSTNCMLTLFLFPIHKHFSLKVPFLLCLKVHFFFAPPLRFIFLKLSNQTTYHEYPEENTEWIPLISIYSIFKRSPRKKSGYLEVNLLFSLIFRMWMMTYCLLDNNSLSFWEIYAVISSGSFWVPSP